jgi:hypothetical protein
MQQEVVGIGIDTVNPPLALQLGRSFSLLAALAVYRFLFAVGTLSVRPPQPLAVDDVAFWCSGACPASSCGMQALDE